MRIYGTLVLGVTLVTGLARAGAGFEQFRGPGRNGFVPAGKAPTAWDEKAGQGILWKQAVPAKGWAAPLVADGKVILTGADAESRQVMAFDLATGKSLWSTAIPAVEGAGETTIDTMDERWNTLMWAAATPAIAGDRVFAAFSSGQLCALDLATGKILWNVLAGELGGNAYGWANSLIPVGGDVIAAFQGDESYIACFAGADGKTLWKTKRESASWASPVLVQTPAGKALVVLPADPDVTAWDAATGKQAWSTKVFEESPDYCVGPSPVVVGAVVCVNLQKNGIFGLDAETGKKRWSVSELADDAEFPDGVSMTTDGRYLYQFYSTVLVCVDPRDGSIVKQAEVDETAGYASPVCVDGNLYLFGGDTLVCAADPAKAFAVVGKGKLNESFDSPPAVVDGRLLIRTDDSLYAIGAP